MLRKVRILSALILLVLVIAGCAAASGSGKPVASSGGAGPTASAGAVATAAQNGIELKATFVNATRAVPGGELLFSFALDNHAVDLDDLNLANKVVLKPAQGEPVSQGFRWRQEGSGHHATGLLSVDNKDARGKPLVTSATPYVVLELTDVGKPGLYSLRFENRGWKLP